MSADTLIFASQVLAKILPTTHCQHAALSKIITGAAQEHRRMGAALSPSQTTATQLQQPRRVKIHKTAWGDLGLTPRQRLCVPTAPTISRALALLLFGPAVLLINLSRKLARAKKMINWRVLGWKAESAQESPASAWPRSTSCFHSSTRGYQLLTSPSHYEEWV